MTTVKVWALAVGRGDGESGEEAEVEQEHEEEVQVLAMEQDPSAAVNLPGDDVEMVAEAEVGSAADTQVAGPTAAAMVSKGAATSAFTRVKGRNFPLPQPTYSGCRSGSGLVGEEDQRYCPLPPYILQALGSASPATPTHPLS
jgi:hypothetical protein